MSKLNQVTRRPGPTSAVTTTGRPAVTHEGGDAQVLDARSELLVLAVANYVSEDTFYEASEARDTRYAALVRRFALEDPQWLLEMLTWLRGSANMRSAAIVGAAEMVRERTAAGLSGYSRQAVNAVLQRADEPGDILAYWIAHYGRPIPSALKRGIGDAVRRLYTERSFLKYDSDTRGLRFGDVIDLTHPKPLAGTGQSELFTHALDIRHGRDDARDKIKGGPLRTLVSRYQLTSLPVEARRTLLADRSAAERLNSAAMTWESLAGWLQGPMDAEAWSAQIPNMGYMALMRNLANFDRAGISDKTAALVIKRLTDPEEVKRSRQLPYRFLSAHLATADSLRWGYALEQALQLSLDNVPALPGRSLIMIDVSGSMDHRVSAKSTMSYARAAMLFGTMLAAKGESVDLIGWASSCFRYPTQSGEQITFPGGGRAERRIDRRATPASKGASVLKAIEGFNSMIGAVGYGTDLTQAIDKTYDGQDRVIILTDDQVMNSSGQLREGHRYGASGLPKSTPVYVFDLAGYGTTTIGAGSPHRHQFAGLSQSAFTIMERLEAGRSTTWPWLEDGSDAR